MYLLISIYQLLTYCASAPKSILCYWICGNGLGPFNCFSFASWPNFVSGVGGGARCRGSGGGRGLSSHLDFGVPRAPGPWLAQLLEVSGTGPLPTRADLGISSGGFTPQ